MEKIRSGFSVFLFFFFYDTLTHETIDLRRKDECAVRDIKFMLRRANGDRRNRLAASYFVRELFTANTYRNIAFLPVKVPSPLPSSLDEGTARDFETNGVYQNDTR